ncbi:SMP-30/gluconolactonase/LRE family protein [Abyssalbus ytuae]|uniref:SMP-30/gluconolactonase/LRE family protein n=1 Tax=Abyssalbus ytuae TaxID=2926907 RepID=A0A9E7A0U3_9FLAO|nr:SMP-30/gluconolactonase/LRE family protein [Abyssalbus ytuae]UOB17661.1 SMP-30/gluconolactonase/LRE family protein [Abyssalbus ytuae]
MKKIILLCLAFLIFSFKESKKSSLHSERLPEKYYTGIRDNKNIERLYPKIERLSPKLDEFIKSSAQLEIISKGYDWAEGPVWIETEKMLLWSDVPKNSIYSWKEGEEAKLYLKPSGYTGSTPLGTREPGSNGLLLSPDGKLVLCQHGDRRLAYMDAPVKSPQPKFISVADKFEEKKFNSPNDAVYDNIGNLYFTDPPYGLKTQNDESPEKEIEFNGVYKVDKEGKVTVLIDSLTRPNGIAFNTDYTRCYVSNSDPQKAYWAVYDVTPDKTFANGKIFFDATNMVKQGKKGLPDGLKVDDIGTLYATGPGGILVLTTYGEHIGTINTQHATANCGFNADKSVLYITADNYIMRLKLL